MRIRNVIIAGLTAAGLGGCTSDPAFWESVAAGLDEAAYELANEPACTWYTDRFGVLQQGCAPYYPANATYYPVAQDRDRDRRDHGDRDGRRDGRRDSDRDDRRDRDGRRGPKGE